MKMKRCCHFQWPLYAFPCQSSLRSMLLLLLREQPNKVEGEPPSARCNRHIRLPINFNRKMQLTGALAFQLNLDLMYSPQCAELLYRQGEPKKKIKKIRNETHDTFQECYPYLLSLANLQFVLCAAVKSHHQLFQIRHKLEFDWRYWIYCWILLSSFTFEIACIFRFLRFFVHFFH